MFAIRLKELREKAGYSQAVLARKLGVRQSTVGMWENGKNKPQNSKLEMMASIFNVSTKQVPRFYAGFSVAMRVISMTIYYIKLHV